MADVYKAICKQASIKAKPLCLLECFMLVVVYGRRSASGCKPVGKLTSNSAVGNFSILMSLYPQNWLFYKNKP